MQPTCLISVGYGSNRFLPVSTYLFPPISELFCLTPPGVQMDGAWTVNTLLENVVAEDLSEKNDDNLSHFKGWCHKDAFNICNLVNLIYIYIFLSF